MQLLKLSTHPRRQSTHPSRGTLYPSDRRSLKRGRLYLMDVSADLDEPYLRAASGGRLLFELDDARNNEQGGSKSNAEVESATADNEHHFFAGSDSREHGMSIGSGRRGAHPPKRTQVTPKG